MLTLASSGTRCSQSSESVDIEYCERDWGGQQPIVVALSTMPWGSPPYSVCEGVGRASGVYLCKCACMHACVSGGGESRG